MPKSKKQEHLTPDIVYDKIEELWGYKKEDMYDPCPPGVPFRSACFFNGLYGDYQRLNYVNCPFEQKILEKFVIKSHQQQLKGNVTVMLLPTKTDQLWFQTYIIPRISNDIYWFDKRIKFKNDKWAATDTHFLARFK